MSILKNNNYWLQFFKEYYKALLGLVALFLGFYIMYSFSADSKLFSLLYIIGYIALAVYFIVYSLKVIFIHKLEIKRLRKILRKHQIDPIEQEAIVNKDML